MVSKEKMRMIQDVRLKRGFNCDSDHFLVQIKIKQKLITINNRQTQNNGYDIQLLNQKEKINKYQGEVQQKLQEMDEKTDIKQYWQNLKLVILEAAKEFKSPKDVKNANNWWDDECKRANQEKNEARGKCLIRKTRTNLESYHQKRTQANRICRRKKKEWMEEKIKLSETNRKRDTRKFYKDVRNLSNSPTETTLICEDKDGNILSEKSKYWKDGSNTLRTY